MSRLTPDPTVGYPALIDLGISMEFESLTIEVIQAGWDHYSARGILHEMRWRRNVRDKNSHFKVNSIWSPLLARWFMKKYPGMKGFFRLRALGAQRKGEYWLLFGEEPPE